MNWLARVRTLLEAPATQIGLGRLVLVVGPSGAGKDSLLRLARSECHDRTDIVFPRRVVTRAASEAEDHATASDSAFDYALSEGAFALWWRAHGLKYGIPLSVDHDIRSGRTVVFNASRTVVGTARERYSSVVVILVTAPRDVLAARLNDRGRTEDGSLMDRLDRAEQLGDFVRADVTIDNVAAPEIGARKLLTVICDRNSAFSL